MSWFYSVSFHLQTAQVPSWLKALNSATEQTNLQIQAIMMQASSPAYSKLCPFLFPLPPLQLSLSRVNATLSVVAFAGLQTCKVNKRWWGKFHFTFNSSTSGRYLRMDRFLVSVRIKEQFLFFLLPSPLQKAVVVSSGSGAVSRKPECVCWCRGDSKADWYPVLCAAVYELLKGKPQLSERPWLCN